MPALFMTSRIVYYRLLESTKRSPYDISNAAKHASLVYNNANTNADCRAVVTVMFSQLSNINLYYKHPYKSMQIFWKNISIPLLSIGPVVLLASVAFYRQTASHSF